MNILPALTHHLNQHTPHKWELDQHNTLHTHIQNDTTHAHEHITITQNDTTLTLEHIKSPPNLADTTIINLLDPQFLTKITNYIHQRITQT